MRLICEYIRVRIFVWCESYNIFSACRRPRHKTRQDEASSSLLAWAIDPAQKARPGPSCVSRLPNEAEPLNLDQINFRFRCHTIFNYTFIRPVSTIKSRPSACWPVLCRGARLNLSSDRPTTTTIDGDDCHIILRADFVLVWPWI